MNIFVSSNSPIEPNDPLNSSYKAEKEISLSDSLVLKVSSLASTVFGLYRSSPASNLSSASLNSPYTITPYSPSHSTISEATQQIIDYLSTPPLILSASHAIEETLFLLDINQTSPQSMKRAIDQFNKDFKRSVFEIQTPNGQTFTYKEGLCISHPDAEEDPSLETTLRLANPDLSPEILHEKILIKKFEKFLETTICAAYPNISLEALNNKINLIKVMGNQSFDAIALGAIPLEGTSNQHISYTILKIVGENQDDTMIVPVAGEKKFVLDFSNLNDSLSAHTHIIYKTADYPSETILEFDSKLTLDFKENSLQLKPFNNPQFNSLSNPNIFLQLASEIPEVLTHDNSQELIRLNHSLTDWINLVENDIQEVNQILETASTNTEAEALLLQKQSSLLKLSTYLVNRRTDVIIKLSNVPSVTRSSPTK